MFGGVHEAQPGDVLVVANDAFLGTAVVGDLSIGMMNTKPILGTVTDSLAPEKAYTAQLGLPFFHQ